MQVCFIDIVTFNTAKLEGCPKILRVDKGTENVHAATAQIALRMNHEDIMAGQKSLIAGTSVHNVVSWIVTSKHNN